MFTCGGTQKITSDFDTPRVFFRIPTRENNLFCPFFNLSKCFNFFVFQDYDIVIWSATNMKWIEEKMKLLGCDRHPGYKLAFYLDSRAMISIHSEKYGVIEVSNLFTKIVFPIRYIPIPVFRTPNTDTGKMGTFHQNSPFEKNLCRNCTM
jgi:hypothetical protein